MNSGLNHLPPSRWHVDYYLIAGIRFTLLNIKKKIKRAGEVLRRCSRQKWFFSALGNTAGSVLIDGRQYSHEHNGKPNKLKNHKGNLIIQSSSGTFGDSLDDFLFYYTEVLPDKQNFELSATFTVEKTAPYLSWQSGYGIFAVDTVVCEHAHCRYRNLLGVGRFRTRSVNEQSSGLRVVSGYQDAGASEVYGKRTLDLSRAASFSGQETTIGREECYRFSLTKANDGFTGRISFHKEEQTFSLPGCDFLMQQDPRKLYVGFAVAGTMTLRISDIQFSRSPGISSVTPEGVLQTVPPDYPFSRGLLEEQEPSKKDLSAPELFVAPNGNKDGDGSRELPLDLQTALDIARPGQTVILKAGVYRPKEPYCISGKKLSTGGLRTQLRAEHFAQAIIDGSALQQQLPVFILRGDAWHLKDLVFCSSPLSGLFICGNYNLIEHCEAHHNRDTGILICSFPGSKRADWPCHNHILCCDSHHNCDTAGENADGFGAKLSIGSGNLFYECVAHHNVDDGFDLFAKNILGPIGQVLIENCVAYRNGRSVFFKKTSKSGGMGFKLGGDNVAVLHTAENCIAFENDECGFGSNYNPSIRLDHVTAYRNGKQPQLYNYRMLTRRTDRLPDWQISHEFPPGDIFYEHAGNVISPLDNANHSGNQKADLLSPDFEQLYADAFLSVDVSSPITRDKDDLINLHGLFSPKEDYLSCVDRAGARLDDTQIQKRLQKKLQYTNMVFSPYAGGNTE